jgi:hypothetical protein
MTIGFIMRGWSGLSDNTKFWIMIVISFIVAFVCGVLATISSVVGWLSVSFNLIAIVLFAISFVLIFFKIFIYFAGIKTMKDKKIVVNLAMITICIVIIIVFYYAVSAYNVQGYLKDGVTSVASALIGGIAADTLIHIRESKRIL